MLLRACNLAPLDVITLNRSSSKGVDVLLNNQNKLTFQILNYFSTVTSNQIWQPINVIASFHEKYLLIFFFFFLLSFHILQNYTPCLK